MDKLTELATIIIVSSVGFAVFVGVVYLTIVSHKKIESRLACEEKKILNIYIAPRDLFNLLLGLPFFLFFLTGPFILDTKWIGIFILDIFAYCALVFINGGFFLVAAIKGYIGVIWGLFLGALSVVLLGAWLVQYFRI
jgi:hypothetical protein